MRNTKVVILGVLALLVAANQALPADSGVGGQVAISPAEARQLLWDGFWAWRTDRDADKAIALYERVLQAFPQGFRADWPENVRELLRSGDEEAIRAAREKYGGLFQLSATAGLALVYLYGKSDAPRAAGLAERALRENPSASRMMTVLWRARQMVAQAGGVRLPVVFANGRYFCGTVEASADGGTTLSSLQEVCLQAAGTVTWDEATQSATATLGEKSITFILGRAVASVKCSVVSGQWSEGSPTTNNQQLITQEIPLRVAPYLNEEGRMIVPLRPLVEALGGTVKWEPEAQIVYVDLPAAAGSQPPEAEATPTEEAG